MTPSASRNPGGPGNLSVPGNLLLLGEYAVLESGGLGVAVAVDRRVEVSIESADTLWISGVLKNRTLEWKPGGSEDNPLFSSIVEECRSWLKSRDIDEMRGARIRIDSSAFFDAGGRKSGFGSSAAVAVALTASLLSIHGSSPGAETDSSIMNLALRAHRRAQGGRGSGYDIATSTYGNCGLFTGGQNPSWEPLTLPWLPNLYLFEGRQSVSTPNSVGKYERWKRENPEEAASFLADSNHCVTGFVRAESWEEALPHFLFCRDLGLRLGRQIGVSAEIDPPLTVEKEWHKALGAGNELGLLATPKLLKSDLLERLNIAERGVMCL
jgi:phosphomevalonate kinase